MDEIKRKRTECHGALEALQIVSRMIQRGENINQIRLHLGREIARLDKHIESTYAWEKGERLSPNWIAEREAIEKIDRDGGQH